MILLDFSSEGKSMDKTKEPEWEKKLNAALDDVKAGRVRRFLSEEEFLDHLKNSGKASKRKSR